MLVGTMLRTTDSLSISEIVLSPSSLGWNDPEVEGSVEPSILGSGTSEQRELQG